jgi:hypothetical protein
MSCPRCGADDIWVEAIFCEKCGRQVKLVCTACHEVIKEKPCDCTQEEVPGDSSI